MSALSTPIGPQPAAPRQVGGPLTASLSPLLGSVSGRAHRARTNTQVQLLIFAQQYHRVLHEPRVYNRQTVFLFAFMTGFGKFMAAYGAYLSAEQFRGGEPGGGAAGCAIGAVGVASFLYGAIKFSQAMARIDPTVAKYVKAWSITGGAVLIGAYACKGLLASKQGPHGLGFDMVGRSLNWLGVTMMGFSFPIFIACSQAVYGPIIVNKWHRLFLGWCLSTALTNIPPVIPTSRSDSEAVHIGTQLAAAVASFGALFGAGFVLSTAWETLGAPKAR